MDIIKYTIFPKNTASDRDGMIATGFLISFFVFTYILLYWTEELLSYSNININIMNSIQYIIPCFIVFIILKLSGEKLETIGIHKGDLRLSLIIGLPFLLIATLIFTQLTHLEYYNLTHFLKQLFLAAVCEEIIFRGYASPRLSKAFGNFGGLIIAGVIFGMYYSLLPIIKHEASMIIMFSYIGLGILGQMGLQYVYTRTNNLILPIMIHASFGILFL